MNVYNCFIISPRARSKRFLVSVISLRQSYDAVNRCSSDIYHLKLVEDKLESSHLTRRLEEIVSYWTSSEMIRRAIDDLLVADFWRSLRSEPSLLNRPGRRDSSAWRLALIDKMKKRTSRRPNFISRNVVTTSNCLICACTSDVSLASMSTPIWATTIIIFLSFSFSLCFSLSSFFFLFCVHTHTDWTVLTPICACTSLSFFRDERVSSSSALLFPFFCLVYSNSANDYIMLDYSSCVQG